MTNKAPSAKSTLASCRSRVLSALVIVLLANAILACAASAFAQAPPALPAAARPAPPPRPTVLALGSFNLVVDNLDTTARFYQNSIGLELIGKPGPLRVDEARNRLMATPNARSRSVFLRIPNETFALELIEFRDIERKAVRANHNDPGSSFMNFGVWNGPAAFAALRRTKPEVISKAGIPPGNFGDRAMVWVRDPDGHMVEVAQGGWDGDRKSLIGVKNVYRSHFGITAERYQDTLAFYRDLLGFDIAAGFPPAIPPDKFTPVGEFLGGAAGVPTSANFTGISGHCAWARCEMFEFRGAARTPFRPRLQDPGAAYLTVWVSDLEGVLAKAKASGYSVVSAEATPVAIALKDVALVPGPGTDPPIVVKKTRQIMIRDPSGFPVLLVQAAN